MKQTVRVTIRRVGNTWQVSNNKGKIWTFLLDDNSSPDIISNVAIAEVSSSMLTATITSHLAHRRANELTYELTVKEE